ncbi:hypothetical protein [Burkholderia pyrrocinia]
MTRHASFEKAKDLDMPFFSIIIAHHVTIVCCVMFGIGAGDSRYSEERRQ